MKRREVTFVTTQDLGLTADETMDIAAWLDATFGDAALTMVSAETFARAARAVLDGERKRTIPDAICHAQVEFVAFIG